MGHQSISALFPDRLLPAGYPRIHGYAPDDTRQVGGKSALRGWDLWG